eukprot:TRINITY_DN12325_c0_g1_i6.p6 TRINITY_DN12325_c0_g1~~TRINITY_DN12325_c0_g1_i6.p6  ORF type:complete len:109 (-),score=2.10 TRINITY_DN12325_c0_g1_i6:645-971(-)
MPRPMRCQGKNAGPTKYLDLGTRCHQESIELLPESHIHFLLLNFSIHQAQISVEIVPDLLLEEASGRLMPCSAIQSSPPPSDPSPTTPWCSQRYRRSYSSETAAKVRS